MTIINARRFRRRTLASRFRNQNNPAIGAEISHIALVLVAGTGAVVSAVTVITESPLPAATCAGLKEHVVSAGAPEQENVTALGNVPDVGATSSE
jgi:hypothetical protein